MNPCFCSFSRSTSSLIKRFVPNTAWSFRRLFSLRPVGCRRGVLLVTLASQVHRALNRLRTVLLHEFLNLGELRAQLLLNRRKITLLQVFGVLVDGRRQLVKNRLNALLVQRDGTLEARIHHPRAE